MKEKICPIREIEKLLRKLTYNIDKNNGKDGWKTVIHFNSKIERSCIEMQCAWWDNERNKCGVLK